MNGLNDRATKESAQSFPASDALALRETGRQAEVGRFSRVAAALSVILHVSPRLCLRHSPGALAYLSPDPSSRCARLTPASATGRVPRRV